MKNIVFAVLVAFSSMSVSGCMGQMGLSKQVTGLNLKAVDNRWGREGLYILMSPLYGIAGSIDLLIINSIEFWSGTNPITGKTPAVVDTPVETWVKANEKMPEATKTAPLDTD
jgi:hypothetical protein